MYENQNICDKYPENGEIIDSKIRKFYFKLREKEVERDLRVTISVFTSDTIEDQNVVIELTNDSNPIFLFNLFITKTDFDILRSDQGINVEYKDFPLAMVNLLDKCAEGVSSNGRAFKLILEDYCGTASGSCLMDMKKFKIKILEECAFKNMCHLTLDVVRGTELQIQQKLQMELIKIKQCLSQESKLHDEALKRISQLVEEINEKNKDLENLSAVIEDVKIQREEDIRKECLRSDMKEKQLRQDYEERISLEQEEFQKKFQELQAKIKDLEKEIIEIDKDKLGMASEILDNSREIAAIKAELLSAKQEIIILQNQNSKLDSDYHDKEKAVNILRTRLAVAEQELKDNNILIINYQKKLEETSQEKIDLQKNLDFIQSKLEKKETVVLNLSEELLKGNEIISKQQAKISLLTSKQIESEETNLVKNKLIEEKENTIQDSFKKIAKLQDDLNMEKKQVAVLNDKIKLIENNLKEKSNMLEKSAKVISIMKENLQNHNSVLKSNSCEKSLLFYRSFLSTPSLLPSDDRRRMAELKKLIPRERRTDNYSDKVIISFEKQTRTVNIIDRYIDRYLKRFVCIPSSLFKSSNVPTTVLTSPEGVAVSQVMYSCKFPSSRGDPFYEIEENGIKNANEYFAYTATDPSLPIRVVSDSSIANSEHNCYQRSLVASCSAESNDVSDDIKDHFLQNGRNDYRYTPVGAFRLGPVARQNNFIDGIKSKKSVDAPSLKSSIRNTPAISAPPLTQKQREVKESALPGRPTQLHRTLGRRNNSIMKSAASRKLMPVKVHVSNSSENNLQHKIPNERIHGAQPRNAANNLQYDSNLMNTAQENEPSAYFMG